MMFTEKVRCVYCEIRWLWLVFGFSHQWGVLKLMQGALDFSSGRASSHNAASSPSSSSVSVLGLLQNVCTNPGAILASVDSHNQSTQPYASANLMETVVKQLLQLAATSASATSASAAYHVTGAGSPLKNGVRACTCVVHLVLLQVWLCTWSECAVFRFVEWLAQTCGHQCGVYAIKA